MDLPTRNGMSAPPPPPMVGNIPARRLQMQPQHEAPACVQNAMMTKDKKPFTYTPGGIDLSQIKSPRMAKRISRNANCEGVTNQPKVSPLAAQTNDSPKSYTPLPSQGMPVQVFPSGPPAPPPPPKLPPNNINGTSTVNKKSLEPPPMGCRPEIKIPPNPMATLKPTPRPKANDDFWVEEFRKERSKSPNTQTADSSQPGNEPNNVTQPNTTTSTNEQTNKEPETSMTSLNPSTSPASDRIASPFSIQPNLQLPRPLSPVKLTPDDVDKSKNNHEAQLQLLKEQQLQQQQQLIEQQQKQQLQQQQKQLERQRQLQQEQQQRQQQQFEQRQKMEQLQKQQQLEQQQKQLEQQQKYQQQQQQRQVQLQQQELNRQMEQQRQQQELHQQQEQIRQQQEQQRQQQLEQQRQHQLRLQQQQKQYENQNAISPTASKNKQNLGSIYIPPIRSDNFNQETLPWMIRKANDKEKPEWVNKDETTVRHGALSNSNSQNSNKSGPKERIIPIQLEKTPSPTSNISSPSFDSQQYYNRNQKDQGRKNSKDATSTYRNPNKFVDQGYNDINYSPTNNEKVIAWQRSTNNHQTPATAKKNLYQTESPDNPFSVNLSDTVSQSPTVLQNGNYRFVIHDCPYEAELRFRKLRLSDPRTLQQQQSWTSPTPSQSKSFKVLQKITDTEQERIDDLDSQPVELIQPHYSRPLGPGDMNENQLRKLQLSEHDRALMKHVKNEIDQEVYLHTEEDPRYRGAAIPSKAFKMLQHMTEGSPGETSVPVTRQNRRFQQHVAAFQPEDQSQHAQSQEPKLYKGASNPSRSFKILQAITTPENAGPGQSDL